MNPVGATQPAPVRRSEADEGKRISPLQIAEAIRTRILKGSLPAGSHLLEASFAAEFGTSRTPVRTALALLARESLVTFAPNRGYEVRRFTLEQTMQAYDIRGALEGMAVRMVAETGISPEGARQMKACLDVVDSILARGQLNVTEQGSWREMNILFHATIERELGNQFLDEILQTMRNVPLVANAVIQWYDFDTVYRYQSDHHRIFDAIVRRQGSRAEAAMREHLYSAREFVRSMLEDRAPNVRPKV
jgi:GntR family transcriptional regulator of vanillate catabolism